MKFTNVIRKNVNKNNNFLNNARTKNVQTYQILK